MSLKQIANRLNTLGHDSGKTWEGKLVYKNFSLKVLEELRDKMLMDELMSATLSSKRDENNKFALTIDDIEDVKKLSDAGTTGAAELLKNQKILQVFSDLNEFDWYPLGHGKMQLVAKHLASGTGYVRNRFTQLGIDEKHVVTENGNTIVTRFGCQQLADIGFSPASDALNHPNPKAPVDPVLADAVRTVAPVKWYQNGDQYVLAYNFHSEATAKIFAGHLKTAGANDPQMQKLGGEWVLWVNKEDAVALVFNGVKNLSCFFPKLKQEETNLGAGRG